MNPQVAEAYNFISQILEEGVQCNGPVRDKIRASLMLIRAEIEADAKVNDAADPDPS